MFRNYLKIALRNLWKNKTYSFINIFGLTLGLSCFLLIALYVFDEMTYDRFHRNANRIYRVVETKKPTEGRESNVGAVAYQVAEQAPKTIPEVKNAATFAVFGRTNVSDPASINVFHERITLANPAFLELFDFKLIEGDRKTALTAPRSVVLTEDMARRIFGATSVTGRSLKTDDDSLLYTVTGVMKNLPSNSHLDFNILFSGSSFTDRQYLDFIARDWTSNTYISYFLLDENADADAAAEKLSRMVAEKRDANVPRSTFSLQPLPSIHFHSTGIEGANTEKRGNITYVYVFSIVAIFVLLIACINYMNLTTARFANRGKEIAVRKVAGADRGNLVTQFLSEALVMALIALVLALGITKIALPAFNDFAGKKLHLDVSTDPRIWVGILITVLVVGLFAGAYPALFQSRLKPYLLLKNKVRQSSGQLSLRKGLVVFQFSLSIIMIVATMVVYLQMRYVNTADMGFNKEQLVVVDINSGAVRRGAETITAEYSKIPGVKSVSVTSRVPGEWKILPKVKVRQAGAGTQENDMYYISADDQFFKTFEVQLLKGRNFLPAGSADSTSVIINEAAAKVLGITEPSEQMVEIPGQDYNGNVERYERPYNARIVGIARDFNFQSMREKVAPLVLAYARNNPIERIDYFTVRLSTADVAPALAQMESLLRKIDPSHLFEYNFLDKQWDIFYREDRQRQAVFLAVAILTILIACLGLFGLATYAAEQRIREIGIRKVLGASVSQLIAMLSKDFIKLVLIAAVIATPIAWWAMHSWLNDFAYRTKLYWWVFAAAGIIAALIAVCTVGLKALRAAVTNPVKSLRTE